MDIVKKPQGFADVHRLPKGMQALHRDYGLWILSVGSHQAPADGFHRTEKRYFEYFSISHMHSGLGRLWLSPGIESTVLPGQCIIITPATINRYGGFQGQPYDEDNICFTGPVADFMRRAGILSDGIFELGNARLLLPVQKLAADPARDSQISANIMLQKLLVDIHLKNKKLQSMNSSTSERVESLLETLKEQSERWWTVAEMAEFCQLSSDQFRRVFLKHTGMLPKIYIDRLKINQAAELLVSSNASVSEISSGLDYQDSYHFSRRFRQLTGISPRKYRTRFKPAL